LISMITIVGKRFHQRWTLYLGLLRLSFYVDRLRRRAVAGRLT
jgi:hypothetical protein